MTNPNHLTQEEFQLVSGGYDLPEERFDVHNIGTEAVTRKDEKKGGLLKTGALAALMLGAMACGEKTTIDPKEQVDPNAIDRTTNNPAHLAEFSKDLKNLDIINANGVSVAKLNYVVVWVEADKKYKLDLIPSFDSQACKTQMQSDAAILGKPVDEMRMEFFYANNSSGTSIGWVIPYNEFGENKSIDLKDGKYDKFIPSNAEGSKMTLLDKSVSGFLRISTGYRYMYSPTLESTAVYNKMLELNPYSFGTMGI